MKAITLSLAIIILLLSVNNTKANTNEQGEYFLYNVGLGVVTTTIGALLNKPKKQSTWECIKKSAWQGFLGGALQYTGKKLTYQIMAKNNYWWGLPSKLVHSAGVSICQNAVRGNEFGQYWVYDYGPVHANFHIKNGQFRFQPQFNLLFLYDAYYRFQNASIDWEKSVKLGALTFTENKEILRYPNGNIANGDALTRTIRLATKNPDIYGTAAHELIHLMQQDEHRVLNSCFTPLTNKIKSKFLKNINQHVYIEFPFFSTLYGLTYWNSDRNNFYEREASDLSSH